MAMQNENLLGLLLTYSASHRSRLLGHPLPEKRIASWTQGLFSTFRQNLRLIDSTSPNFNEHLAITVMLASLAIVSPNTFEASIPWHVHLQNARVMLMSCKDLPTEARSLRFMKNRELSFLSRWFFYLDTMGSFTQPNDLTSLFDDLVPSICGPGSVTTLYCSLHGFDNLYGCNHQTLRMLGHIASVARQAWEKALSNDTLAYPIHLYTEKIFSQCESCKRTVPLKSRATQTALLLAGAMNLRQMRYNSMGLEFRGYDLVNTNQDIIAALDDIKPGGTAEAGMLFPLFTAGCDARTKDQKKTVMDRFHRLEKLGMAQV